MGAGKGERIQFFGRKPAAGCRGHCFYNAYVKRLQGDAVTGDGMLDAAEGFGFGHGEGDGVGLVEFDFDVGEFPEVGVHDLFRPLADEEFTIVLDDESGEMAGGGSFPFAEVGQFFRAAFFEGDAELLHGAKEALRTARGADPAGRARLCCGRCVGCPLL